VEDAETHVGDVASAVRTTLLAHPAVRAVRPIGSRAEGRAHDLSDWDFAVETDDFETVARDLPRLVGSLHPLAEQWDRYNTHACYMLMLHGPTKVDLLFLDQPREWEGPWQVSRDTLEAIDHHFWDWSLWLEQKRRGRRDELVVAQLALMHELLLEPMGVSDRPGSVADAVTAYIGARAELESRFAVTAPRHLEREVRPLLEGA
jgi:hypothetical protein